MGRAAFPPHKGSKTHGARHKRCDGDSRPAIRRALDEPKSDAAEKQECENSAGPVYVYAAAYGRFLQSDESQRDRDKGKRHVKEEDRAP